MKYKDILESEKLHNSEKFKNVMKEFTDKTLKSSNGKLVTDQKQALAIAYSEAKRENDEI